MASSARARWSVTHDAGVCTLDFKTVPGLLVTHQHGIQDGHPTPQDLLDAALAASAALRLARYIRRTQCNVRALELEVTHAFTPAGLVLTLAIQVVGRLSDERQQRLLRVAHGCAIHKVLAGRISIVTLEQLRREGG